MKMAVISRGAELYTTRRLLVAGRARGHEMLLVPILNSWLQVSGERPELWLGGERVTGIEAVIPRIGSFMPSLALSLLRHWEGAGVPTLNRSHAIAGSRDKWRTLERLGRAGIPVPRTVLMKDLDQLPQALAAVGGVPVVIKPLVGEQGRAVVLAESHEGALSVLEALLYLNRDLIVQEFLPECSDLRALVSGGRLLAAARRRAPQGRFRANLHQGGTLERVSLSPELTELALAATWECGLTLAGVDLLENQRGPVVLEVNAAPGLEGLESCTGLDLASQIVDDAVEAAVQEGKR